MTVLNRGDFLVTALWEPLGYIYRHFTLVTRMFQTEPSKQLCVWFLQYLNYKFIFVAKPLLVHAGESYLEKTTISH